MSITMVEDEIHSTNPDDDLDIWSFIMKYQLQFTRHFGPKHAYGVTKVGGESHRNGDILSITARVRPIHKPVKGSTCEYRVPMDKFNIWRNNVKLYDFISDKSA